MTAKQIVEAKLEWGARATARHAPRSALFNDIYFSGDGVAETTHVFLAGNDLPARFSGADHFVIGELGFGAGLNFLVAWDAWSKTPKPDGARLHFLSVEKHPLAAKDLAKAHQAWPALADKSARLRALIPPPAPGAHRLAISDRVSLSLLYGDALDALASTEALADAWFLDGFAPDRNPEMWSAPLMQEVARRSAPASTCATFTVAGSVRRALECAGFALEKRPGFGRKRHMLAGRFQSAPVARPTRKPWFDTAPAKPAKAGARVGIIGAGVAGASLAKSLSMEGFIPIVYEADAPASGASGNPAGIIMPRLDADDTPAARFHASAYLHTIRLLSDMPSTVFNPCGVRRRPTSPKERARQEKLLAKVALPSTWLKDVGDGLLFPQGGVVDPPAMVRALLGESEVRCERVQRLCRDAGGWRIETAHSRETCDAVVIAAGLEALGFDQTKRLPLAGSAGQIDWFRDAAPPETVLAFGPYAAPAPAGGMVIGATYAPIAIGAEARFSPEATQSNIDAVARGAPEAARRLRAEDALPRVSVRCTTPDRLPIAGPVPDWDFYATAYDGLRTGARRDYPKGRVYPGLFVLTGLGSRGLVTAPLCAAMIASEIAGAPSPVDSDVAETLHPARFRIRDLKRNR